MIIDGVELESMTLDGVEVQTWLNDGVEVYSAGRLVTYHVDSGVKYVEKIKKGLSALHPTTFTPSKSGWAFVGWREDTTASGSVLSNKVVEKSEITLYAVFAQTVTISYNGNKASGGSTASQSDSRYYNAAGNYSNPTFKLAGNGFSKDMCTFTKWAMGGTGGTQYSAGANVTLSSSATFYALWYREPVTNHVLAQGNDGNGSTYLTFNTNGYSSVVATITMSSVWGYVGIGLGTSCSWSETVNGDSGTVTKSINVPADSGNQNIAYFVGINGSYGGDSSNTEWKVTITAR